MQPFDEDTPFEDLPLKVYRSLVKELNKDSAWKVMAKYLVGTVNSFGESWIDSLEQEANAGRSPGNLLLDDLDENMRITIGILCEMLEHCNLLDALLILDEPEHSNSSMNGKGNEVPNDDTFSIICKSTGSPLQRHRRLHGNIEMTKRTVSSCNALMTSRAEDDEHECRSSEYNRVDGLVDHEYTATLRIKPTSVVITKQPASVEVKLGNSLVLSCEAKGHPSPQYQWYKNDKQLDGENCNILRVEKFDRENKGDYYCIVSNVISEKRTNKIEVKVQYPRQKASAKIALIIANNDYQYEEESRLRENDAALIATLLDSIGFHVICLQNLTLEEMKNAVEIFCAVLRPDSYVLFYYVGPGFSHFDNFHMMPVDLPEKFLMNDTFSQDQLLACVDKKKPVLFVCILDMYLKRLPEELNPDIYREIPETCRYECNDNLILAYAMCSRNSSYERGGASDGLYAAQLTKHITSDRPAHEIFMDVAHAVRESNESKTQDQNPMLMIVKAEPYRYLTDEVICQSSGFPTRHNSDLADLTIFTRKTVKIKFRGCGVSCRITIQPLKPPYANVIQLKTSGLEEWEVYFRNSPGDPVKLVPMGRNCTIFNPQRISNVPNQGSLLIHIGKNGIIRDSKRFSYMKHAPEIIKVL